MKTNNQGGWTYPFAVGLALTLALMGGRAAVAAEVPGVVLKKSGQRIEGMIQWQPASKVYLVRDRTNPNVSLKLPPSDVAQIQVKPPADLEPAARAVAAGQFAKAIPVLETIATDFAMLQWDIVATRWLAEAYLKSGDSTKALAACDKVLADNPDAALSGEFAHAYWRALKEKQQYEKLRKVLGEMAGRGTREDAAVAQVLRGDIDMDKGNFREALVDGYLRTIVLFQKVTGPQPEALYKASKCFEELGQTAYAEKMRKKLLTDYPQDPYAEKVKAGT